MNDSTQPRIFVGSSGKCADAGVIDEIASGLEDVAAPVKWTDLFKTNDITIEALVEEAQRADFGLFVFAKDDSGESKGKPMRFPRDNVVMEAGMFIAALGRKRVFILVEKGAKVPSDLLGVNLPSFELSDGDQELMKDSIRSALRGIPPR